MKQLCDSALLVSVEELWNGLRAEESTGPWRSAERRCEKSSAIRALLLKSRMKFRWTSDNRLLGDNNTHTHMHNTAPRPNEPGPIRFTVDCRQGKPALRQELLLQTPLFCAGTRNRAGFLTESFSRKLISSFRNFVYVGNLRAQEGPANPRSAPA